MIHTEIKKIWHLLERDQRCSIIAVFFFMFIGIILEAMSIGLVLPMIAILGQENWLSSFPKIEGFLAGIGLADHKSTITVALSILLTVFMIKNAFLAIAVFFQANFAFSVRERVSIRLLKTYMMQPYAFHLQRNTAHLIRNITSEAGGLPSGVLIPILMILSEILIMFVIGTVLLIATTWSVIGAISLLGVGGAVLFRSVRKRLDYWGERRLYHDGMRIQHIQQGLGGVKDAKILGCENVFLDKFGYHNKLSSKFSRNHMVMQQIPRLWFEMLAILSMVALIFILMFYDWTLQKILPTLGLFSIAAFRLAPSANRILISVQQLRYYRPIADIVLKELKQELPNITSSCAVTRQITSIDNIKIKELIFRYPCTSSDVLQKIDLEILSGQSIGIIGESGSGKSTLIDVALGLLKPTSGMVLVNGTNIMENLREWQNNIGYVSQSIYLTDDTLRNNIAYGVHEKEINNQKLMRAVNAAQLATFINSFSDGLDSMVGERGVRISGGQRQRIGIARALYHDPAVLVLDEATSALDYQTESSVMEAIHALHGKKIIIIVAHRLSTVKHCDKLFKIGNGIIVQEGTYNSVVKSSLVHDSNDNKETKIV